MTQTAYLNGELTLDGVSLHDIAAQFDTPCYVYSHTALAEAYRQYAAAFSGFPHLICYAMKANSNLSILKLFAELGAGFDIVSGGELQRALAAGAAPDKIVFSGVGKSAAEMRMALEAGIHCFNVESESELHRLNAVAASLGLSAPVSLRVNPDVDAKTHPYISTGLKGNKFGIAHDEALRVYQLAASLPNLRVIGIDCHIGSQLTEVAPFVDALDRILALVDALQAAGITLRHIDLGGGIGIRYTDETPPAIAEYAQAVLAKLTERQLSLILEPGRSLVGNAGLLLSRVEFLKPGETRNFAITDAAMNDLMRPALYEAYHQILPIREHSLADAALYDVVGPICESGDWLGRERLLALEAGDLLAILSAGAYGMTMSSNYNTRPRAAEVLVQDGKARLIRQRESIAQLLENEVGLL